MFELVFLGTAAGVPAVDRGLPALAVLCGAHRFLVDCGEGTQRQLLKSGLGFRRLEQVLLTHGHLDHVLGLGGLAGTLALLKAVRRFEIHGGEDALRAVRHLLSDVVWPDANSPLEVALAPLEAGTLLEDDALCLSAFPVRHRETQSFGFCFEAGAQRPMLAEKLLALGVPAGPERRRLAYGETVVLADGRRIAPDDVLGPPRPGGKLVVIGDAQSTDDLVTPASGADALVIEATFLERDADKAAERGHLTAARAARLASEAEVKRLFLTHLSPRYRQEEIEAEARAVFPDTEVVRDFDRFTVGQTAAAGG